MSKNKKESKSFSFKKGSYAKNAKEEDMTALRKKNLLTKIQLKLYLKMNWRSNYRKIDDYLELLRI